MFVLSSLLRKLSNNSQSAVQRYCRRNLRPTAGVPTATCRRTSLLLQATRQIRVGQGTCGASRLKLALQQEARVPVVLTAELRD